MLAVDNKSSWYLHNFELLEKGLDGESKSKIHAIRKTALARFQEVGFPTTHDEEWRFTNIMPIRNAEFLPAFHSKINLVTPRQIEHLFVTDSKSVKLVFVNGQYSKTLSETPSSVKGLQVTNLATALHIGGPAIEQNLACFAQVEKNPFVALSTAFIQDGAFVQIGDGVTIDQPIECLFVSVGSEEPLIANPRNLFLIGKRSRGAVVENYASLDHGPFFNNVVSEIVVGEDSIFEHDKLENESESSYHVATIQIQQAARSNCTNNVISLGGKIVRNNITVVLADRDAEATLNGLSLGTGDQLMDSHTTIDHTMPHCASHELYKSILDGKARGVFNGKIFVRQDAQKTDAKQTNKTLLLSDEATINTKPQLEIFADDVKCTHGAAVGQLDEEQIFYLRSRGIGERSAKDMLTLAFASDVVERIKTDAFRERLRGLIQDRLELARNTNG